MTSRLEQEFYQGSTIRVAKKLLGKTLVRSISGNRLSGVIVEVEAYLWRDDPACHAARGMTRRNETMFRPSGKLYVYSIHSCWCMNVVTEIEGRGAAVLIRAIQPMEGLHWMSLHRPVTEAVELTNGPGKLCQALSVGKHQDGTDLVAGNELWIEEAPFPRKFRIRSSPRIGIREGVEFHYRFFVDNNRYVSGKSGDHSIGRTEEFEP